MSASYTPPHSVDVISGIYTNQGLSSEIVDGGEFIQRFPVPWVPWQYAYKKEFLLRNNIRFVENARFEDTDYVILCTLYAEKMRFIPLDVVAHTVNRSSTSIIGNDIVKITDLFRLSSRIKSISEDFMIRNRNAAMAAMHHHIFHYHSSLVSYLWRIPYVDIVKILKKYPPYPQGEDRLVDFVGKHPYVYAIAATIARPFLLLAWKLKKRLR